MDRLKIMTNVLDFLNNNDICTKNIAFYTDGFMYDNLLNEKQSDYFDSLKFEEFENFSNECIYIVFEDTELWNWLNLTQEGDKFYKFMNRNYLTFLLDTTHRGFIIPEIEAL